MPATILREQDAPTTFKNYGSQHRRGLTRQVGELPQDVRERVETLCLEQLENLAVALLDFTSMADLQVWLVQVGVNKLPI